MRVQEQYIAFGNFVRSFLAYLSASSQRERMGLARILIGNLIEDIRTRSPEKDVAPFLTFLDVLNQEIEIDSDHERSDMTPFRLVLLDQMNHQIESKMPNSWNNLVGSVGHALGEFILANAIKLKGEGKINDSDGRSVSESGSGVSGSGGRVEGEESARLCTDCVSRNAAEPSASTEGAEQSGIPQSFN